MNLGILCNLDKAPTVFSGNGCSGNRDCLPFEECTTPWRKNSVDKKPTFPDVYELCRNFHFGTIPLVRHLTQPASMELPPPPLHNPLFMAPDGVVRSRVHNNVIPQRWYWPLDWTNVGRLGSLRVGTVRPKLRRAKFLTWPQLPPLRPRGRSESLVFGFTMPC